MHHTNPAKMIAAQVAARDGEKERNIVKCLSLSIRIQEGNSIEQEKERKKEKSVTNKKHVRLL